ncbi:MAG: hypothetical protein ACI4UN_07495, partial [Muribaculaceae bacterium]
PDILIRINSVSDFSVVLIFMIISQFLRSYIPDPFKAAAFHSAMKAQESTLRLQNYKLSPTYPHSRPLFFHGNDYIKASFS